MVKNRAEAFDSKKMRNGEIPNSDFFNVAIRFKNLKWLKDRNCSWDVEVFKYAVRYGNMKVLNWLFENDCPYDPDLYDEDIKFGNGLNTVTFLVMQRLTTQLFKLSIVKF